MRPVVIDCANVRSEADFWSLYVRAAELDGAGYFGCNLAAFRDALNGGPGWPGECELHFVNTASVRLLGDGRFYEVLRDIARDSSFIKVHVS